MSPELSITITRHPVESSSLQSIGYSRAARGLEVAFKSGSVYRYHNLPRSRYTALCAAPSEGKHFAAHIRTHYPYSLVQRR